MCSRKSFSKGDLDADPTFSWYMLLLNGCTVESHHDEWAYTTLADLSCVGVLCFLLLKTFKWSSHCEGRFWPIELVLPTTFMYWGTCTKSGKWTVEKCVRGNDLTSVFFRIITRPLYREGTLSCAVSLSPWHLHQ